VPASKTAFSLFLVVFVAPALALPAPMSDRDLMDTSDLVALVRVLSVTCTTVTKDEQTGEELPGYLAKLKLLEVKKGGATAGDEVLVTLACRSEGDPGAFDPSYQRSAPSCWRRKRPLS
jgi:hypothetical protein